VGLTATEGTWPAYAKAYRTDLATPLLSLYSTSTTVGTATTTTLTYVVVETVGELPISLRNWQRQTRFGGYAWSVSDSTVLSALTGAHAATLVDSSSTTATTLEWSAVSTYSFGSGGGIVLEPIPRLIANETGNEQRPYLHFSAFPDP
jgi:hypothetical protein